MPTMNVQGDAPLAGGAPITPSDSADLPRTTRAILITVAGTVKVDLADGSTISFLSGSLAIGVIHWLSVKKVYSTGTAATGIFGLY